LYFLSRRAGPVHGGISHAIVLFHLVRFFIHHPAGVGLYRFTVTLLDISPEHPLLVVCYMPVFLILMKCGRYENPLSPGTALLVIVLISVFYQKISRRIGRLRFPLLVILTVTFYYIAGIAVLVFVFVAALFELFEDASRFSALFFFSPGRRCACFAVYFFSGWMMAIHFFR